MSSKISPLSGFPEWLPEQRLVEQHILDSIRRSFESFGFAPIETRAVEPIERLTAGGETDKEIYALRRIHDDDADDREAKLGLHFDLTVPLARYVEQHRGTLAFPFKRYQVQKVWRGERPQEGRYREFLQADIDVVAQDKLPLHFDAEMPRLLYETLKSMNLPEPSFSVCSRTMGGIPFERHMRPPFIIKINNRKVLEGVYRALGIKDITATLRIVDKLDKIGEEQVGELLRTELNLSANAVETCLAVGRISASDESFVDSVCALGPTHDLLDEGLEELAFVMRSLRDLPAGSVVADLRIARGLDYYTGTVYEGVMEGHEALGAICAGGRYDNLVSIGNHKLPGVGVSIGVTRILGRMFGKNLLRASRSVPTCVLIALPDDESRPSVNELATGFRKRGLNCETYHEPAKFGKQIKYAEKRGIPFVWFPPMDGQEGHEVKDIRSGEQQEADPESWAPPEADLEVRMISE